MKALKYILALLIGLLGFILGYGAHTVQSLLSPTPPASLPLETREETTPGAARSEEVASSTTPIPQKAIEVPVSKLSPSQKALLGSLGIDSEKITITPEMVACAYVEIGEARVRAIVESGEKATTMELVKAATCIK